MYIGVEYDGKYWHKNKIQKDTDKVLNMNEKLNIQIINLRETGLPLISENSITIKRVKTKQDYNNLLQQTLKLIHRLK